MTRIEFFSLNLGDRVVVRKSGKVYKVVEQRLVGVLQIPRFCQIRQDRNWAEFGPRMSLKPANIDRWIAPKPVAEVCFYGTPTTGAGWLVKVLDREGGNVPAWSKGIIGTGDPVEGRTFTEALYTALDQVRAAGLSRGLVTVYESSGAMMASLELAATWPVYGDLNWIDAPIFAANAEQLKAAAAR